MQTKFFSALKNAFHPLVLLSFVAGFVLMAYELAAARILAPSIGSSMYVWTSVIGTIMVALSVGYYAGGKLADARNEKLDVVALCFATAGLISVTLVMYPPLLVGIEVWQIDQRIKGVVAALVLFAPASVTLGMISPYVAKLNITSLKTSGQEVAILSAVNSVGSIAGTFAAGFILFSMLGSRETLLVLLITMLLAGWLIVPRQYVAPKVIFSIALVLAVFGSVGGNMAGAIDTPSATYQIREYRNNEDRLVRGIIAGPNGVQSGVYVDAPDELVFWYTRAMAEVIEQVETPESILILGGGTYTLPRYLAQTYPEAQIDVVEIDPKLVDVAREHFFYNDPPNVTIHHTDARVFVNQAAAQYDVILADVYNDASVPFSLMTKEYGEHLQAMVAPDGIVVANAIASTEGQCRPLYDAMNEAYRTLGDAHLVRSQSYGTVRGNMLMVYGAKLPDLPGYRMVEAPKTTTYTDDFMPAEALQQACWR